ncbi:MAG TPA: hydrogenase nickel incorporation protein HypB [Thermoanaerobaculia bacterium]|nr:hydrogenase nickel incorporation protein HypB [Thermoanaerobaculia bacterium]
MCQDCGCGDPEVVPVKVQQKILARNDRTAAHNRDHFLGDGILAINLMGSPGAGKTAVLEATARALPNPKKVAALAGDLATENDANRITAAGIRSKAITTGQACHLDAELVHRAVHHFDLDGVEYLFIENVGNLVCPAVYDLGQAFNVVALSITEGEDKPLKYPTMFAKADLVLLTKADLLPHLPFVDVDKITDALARVMPNPRVISVSAQTGFGIEAWIRWLATVRTNALEKFEVYA